MSDTEMYDTKKTPSVFWSWQNDRSPITCRSFIRECLAEAISQIASEFDLNDADRPSIDHDTKGERGMADITATILNKIARSAVFVADLTPIVQTDGGKWVPNPNVMIELGWAMHRPGWERVIGVLNIAHGAAVEDLPFDIRQRRVICYNLAADADKPTRKVVRVQLIKELKDAIVVNLDDRAEELSASVTIKGIDAKPENPSIWKTAKPTLIHGDAFGGANQEEIGIPDVARAYMRVIPVGWRDLQPSISDIASMHQNQTVDGPTDGASSGNYGATEEGYVRYWITENPGGPNPQSSGMTMYFEDTGEFWTLHGSAAVEHQGQILIRDEMMLAHWSKTLRKSMDIFDQYGARSSRLVKAGLFGVKDAKWYAQWHADRPNARRNATEFTFQSTDWSASAQIKFLTNAYNNVRDLFARSRLPESEITAILMQHDPQRFSGRG